VIDEAAVAGMVAALLSPSFVDLWTSVTAAGLLIVGRLGKVEFQVA